MIRESIHAAIKEALIDLGAPDVHFVVERPASLDHGDYATNAALAAAKVLKQNPKEVAEQLRTKLTGEKVLGVLLARPDYFPQQVLSGVQTIEVAGAGFINFFLSREAIVEEVFAAAQNKDWGKSELYRDKTIMVEYTDPNPFKEFHIGHLMSNAIGESIARSLEHSGANVIRANYQGDVGPHVAKALFVLLEQGVIEPTIVQISMAYVEGAKRYEENAEEKKAIDALNKKIYEKTDETVNTLYQKGREVSLEHFEELYKTLGTKFDHYFFESETGPKGLTLVKQHPEVFEMSDGATVFRGENYGLHTRVFVTSNGIPTYEAKDLGLLKLKEEKEAVDESISITANEQSEYFKVVLEAAKHIPELEEFASKTRHVAHGMMRFAEGKMSSRKGNVITGESLLNELEARVMEKISERGFLEEVSSSHPTAQDVAAGLSKKVAVGAIKYAVLKQGSGKDIIFDPEKSLSLEGDSGPYVQYAHTRAFSLIEAAAKTGLAPAAPDQLANQEIFQSANALERTLLHYPEVVARAAQELEPHYVTTYITELAGAFNSWYASTRVIGGEYPEYGLLLAQATEQTLKKGLQVLGIPAPEKM